MIKMEKKIISFVIVSLFLMTIVFANMSLGLFSRDSNVRITRVCSDATYINLTSISYPNSSIAVSNIEMSSTGNGEFYYEFNKTNDIGRYDVRGISDGCENNFATWFEVTPTGRHFDNSLSAIIIASLSIIVLIGLLSFGVATYYNQRLVKISFYTFSALIFLMAILYSVVIVQQTLYGFDAIINSVETFIFVMSVGAWLGFLGLLIVVFFVMLKAWKIKRGYYD